MPQNTQFLAPGEPLLEPAVASGLPKERSRLFIGARTDGLGETVKALVYGAALAERFGMVFGGMVGGGHVSHSVNMTVFVAQLFGSTDLFPESAADDSRIVHLPGLKARAKDSLLARLQHAMASSPGNYLIPADKYGLHRHLDHALHAQGIGDVDELLTPELLATVRSHWRQALGSHTVVRVPGRPLVAVHVRRGDVTRQEHKHRLTSDDWYFSLLEQIIAVLPECDVHVFSSLEGQYSASAFDPYRERGMTVHLDTDPLWDWVQMSSADVLVMAKSAYSHVPALINQNCVIYQPYWSMPLRSWTHASKKVPVELLVRQPDGEREVVDAQDTCLGRVAGAQGAGELEV